MVARSYVYPELGGSGNNRNGRVGHPSGVVVGAARSGETITNDRTLDIGTIAQMLPVELAKLIGDLICVIAQLTAEARGPSGCRPREARPVGTTSLDSEWCFAWLPFYRVSLD